MLSATMLMASPTWMPGTTEISTGGQLAGYSHVNVDGSGKGFTIVEHLVLIVDPKGITGRAAYPPISPRTDTGTHSGSVATHKGNAKTLDEFVVQVNDETTGLHGCTVRYYVAGVNLYVGRPETAFDLTGGRESDWVDEISLEHMTSMGGTKAVTGFVYAEGAVGGVFLVHQCYPFNLHLQRPDSGTCALATNPKYLSKHLRVAFNAVTGDNPDQAILYARAHVEVGKADWVLNHDFVAKNASCTPQEPASIRGIYKLPPLV